MARSHPQPPAGPAATTEPSAARDLDYLVVGSGIAGLYAALELAKHGRVAVLTKSQLREGNTQYAQGGIAAALGRHDSPDLHFADTMRAGAGLNAAPAVRVMVEEGPRHVRALMDLGARFDRRDGQLALAQEGAHSLGRVLRAGGDATGIEVERALADQARRAGIELVEDTLALDLLVEDGWCRGLIAADRAGRQLTYRALATILATGGAGQVFANTSNATVVTGDGLAMAWRAGAALLDMEFFQFHPTALARAGNPRLLISEAVRGEGATLRNAAGERFMPGYHELAELAPRDVVARAILQEAWAAGDEHVWLDARDLAGGVRAAERFPTIFARLREHGIDMGQELVPVAPAAHYCMGGVRTDTHGRTSLPGLYACGETACLGSHGANRLASNSLLESLVLAWRAGAHAGGWDGATWDTDLLPPGAPHHTVELPPLVWEQPPDVPPIELAAAADRLATALRAVMWQSFGLIRDGAGMAAGWRELAVLGAAPANAPASTEPPDGVGPGLAQCQWNEARNLLATGVLIAAAATFRRESRGAHHRTDYPESAAAWRAHTVQWRTGRQLSSGLAPLANVEVRHGL